MAFWVDAVVKKCLDCTRKLGLKIIFRIAWDYYAADIYDGVWYEFVLWTIQIKEDRYKMCKLEIPSTKTEH